jgi:hypothetical protein
MLAPTFGRLAASWSRFTGQCPAERDPASVLTANCPAPLAAIIARCLAEDRDKRYETARELSAALAEAARELCIELSPQLSAASTRTPPSTRSRALSSRPSSPHWSRSWWLLSFVTVATVALVLGVWRLRPWQAHHARLFPRASSAAPEPAPLEPIPLTIRPIESVTLAPSPSAQPATHAAQSGARQPRPRTASKLARTYVSDPDVGF